MSVFASNMWWLPIYVNKGDLDYHLVRPVSPLFILSFKEFAANSVMNIFAAIGISIWAINNYASTVSDFNPLSIFTYLFFLFIGIIIHWLLNLSFLIPVFWMHSNRGLGNLFYSVDQFSERPIEIFKGWVRLALLTVLPFGLVASIPASIFFDGLKFETAANMIGILIFYSLFINWFWKKGLRSYSSASS
jgi:ABC-2 type transport system permease protein